MTKKLTAVVMIICIGITALTGCGKKTVSKAVLKNDIHLQMFPVCYTLYMLFH